MSRPRCSCSSRRPTLSEAPLPDRGMTVPLRIAVALGLVASLAIAALLTMKAREWPLVLAVAALALVVIAVHPARSRLALRYRAPDRVLAGLAALAVVP